MNRSVMPQLVVLLGVLFSGPLVPVVRAQPASVFTPDDRTIQTPNSDTPYSQIGTDLRAEPLVISVPAIEKDRYYSLQFIDLYTHNYAYVGSRTTGNEAGNFLLAGPNWNGEKPNGVKEVIRCETQLGWVLFRTQLFSPDDIENVKVIQAGYRVQTLSEFLDTTAPSAPAETDFIQPLSPEQQRNSVEFFNVLNFLLPFCPTHPTETELRARFADLGLGTGDAFDATRLPSPVKQALERGMADAWEEFAEYKRTQVDTGKRTSADVFDLDAGPVTVTLPDARNRFLSMQVINQDHFTPLVVYDGGKHTLNREQIGMRYVFTAIRILADPNDPQDIAEAVRLQDAIRVEQPGGPGEFEAPAWDPGSQKTVRDALNVLADTLQDKNRMFGAKGEVDPVRHLLGAASGWGGNPDKDAVYLNVVPKQNDGKTPYTLTLEDVPVDEFWSISVYNKDGSFEKNEQNAYTVNNITAQRNADGSVTVHFGGDQTATNYLPITPGWNYLLRLYRPRTQILDGSWTPPRPRPVD